jgi:hypothetical protein
MMVLKHEYVFTKVCMLCFLLQLDQYNQRIQDKRELHYQEIRNLKKQGVWKRRPSVSQGISVSLVLQSDVWAGGHRLGRGSKQNYCSLRH